ncbi:isoprenylcysteine carboxylmethyltransferase family protein [Sphingomonas sp.]|uniref:methyltransferase family protein n=1 Tax=Sphingomonas sp. TaxID=28214 RepID=UPI001D1C2862|nr:isoprenylcysteine carboxylmethyltransferase family protein [Sphingomonas sp.]MBX9795570.1 isoprenylcysteine carboxylmethyltransferase family protein [Sphingomonas sp.]
MISMPVGLPGLLAFGLGLALFLIALLAARQRATVPAVSGGKRDARSIPWIILQGVGIFIAGFGPINRTLDFWSARALIDGAVVLLLMLAAVALFHWSSRAMGRNWALVARTRGDGTLVTTGPFALVRNPIYVALALFMLAMAIAYGHFLQLVLAVPVYGFATYMRVMSEERVLHATFGAAYDAYRARVKRFVPGLF